MSHCHGGCDFVYILTARPGRSRKSLLQIRFANPKSLHSVTRTLSDHGSLNRIKQDCRWRDSNPHLAFARTDFKSVASAISPHRLFSRTMVKLVDIELYSVLEFVLEQYFERLRNAKKHSQSWAAVYTCGRFSQSQSTWSLSPQRPLLRTALDRSWKR